MTRRITIAAAVLAVAAAALPCLHAADAHTIEAGELLIIHPTARPNIPNRPMAAYVTIANDGAEADRLTGVSAPDFGAAEVHAASMTDGVMSMSRVETIDLPAGETVELAPGGYHIMLFGAKKLFKPGDVFPMVLTFEHTGDVAVDVMVEKLDPSQMGAGQMDHGAMHMPKASN